MVLRNIGMGNLRHITGKGSKIQGFPPLKFHVPVSLQIAMLGLTCSNAHHPSLGYPVPLAWLCSSSISAWLLIGLLPYRWLPHWKKKIKKKWKRKKKALNSVLIFLTFFFFNYMVALAGIHAWQEQEAAVVELGTISAPRWGRGPVLSHPRDSSSLPLSLWRWQFSSYTAEALFCRRLGEIQQVHLCFSIWSHTILSGFYGYAGCSLFRLNEQTIKYPAAQPDLKQ